MSAARERAILVIGGLDPTGQAGLGRDIEVLSSTGWRVAPVATALTVQTSAAYDTQVATDAAVLTKQMTAAGHELDIVFAKVGAIFDEQQVIAVYDHLVGNDIPFVLDPVLGASSGGRFLDACGKVGLEQRLVPEAALVTPNAQEANRLDLDGARAVLVTHGGESPDELLIDGTTIPFPTARAPGTHRGTGCRLTARIAGMLAHGLPLEEAVAAASREHQSDLHEQGQRQVDRADPARAAHLTELEDALPRILHELRYEHVPEVGMNLAYALPGAKDPRRDVAGLAGRITIRGYDRGVVGRVTFGGPHHTGRIAVVVQEYDPECRIVMNHRFDEAFPDAAERSGLVAVGFRREDEPPQAPSSMEWGVRDCIQRNGGKVPDLIFDRGGVGKEAMIRVLATDPADLLEKLRQLHAVSEAVADADGRAKVDPVPGRVT